MFRAHPFEKMPKMRLAWASLSINVYTYIVYLYRHIVYGNFDILLFVITYTYTYDRLFECICAYVYNQYTVESQHNRKWLCLFLLFYDQTNILGEGRLIAGHKFYVIFWDMLNSGRALNSNIRFVETMAHFSRRKISFVSKMIIVPRTYQGYSKVLLSLCYAHMHNACLFVKVSDSCVCVFACFAVWN